MSFYGNVVYEFKKMFSKLKVIKTSDSVNLALPESTADATLEASSMWEQIDLKPSNRWIQLDCTNVNDTTKTVTIGHSAVGAGGDAVKSVEVVAEAGASDVQLKNGDILKTLITRYDEAGHIAQVSTEYQNYKLPVATISLLNKSDNDIIPDATTDKINFEGDNWIILSNNDGALKISHLATEDYDLDAKESFQMIKNIDEEDLPENVEYITLEPGDYIKSYNVFKDSNCGHLIEAQEVYFKLPMTDNDRDYTDAQNRLSFFEETLGIAYGDEIERDESNEFYQYDTLAEEVKNNNNFLNSLRADYYDEDTGEGSLETLTGKLSNIYVQTDDDGQLVNAHSLAETIGSMDADSESVRAAINNLRDKNEDFYTISEAIQFITTEVKTNRDTASNLQTLVAANRTEIAGLKTIIEQLTQRIEALESLEE